MRSGPLTARGATRWTLAASLVVLVGCSDGSPAGRDADAGDAVSESDATEPRPDTNAAPDADARADADSGREGGGERDAASDAPVDGGG
ncbi:MAG: hypothetical protein JWM82_747, partial [Myxococcales bacterium]|nr:hypothetical protein [Myxococcales bacterium]